MYKKLDEKSQSVLSIIIVHSPALETADTSVGSEIQLIPGRTMGYLHPKRVVMRVRIDAAVMIVKSSLDWWMLPFVLDIISQDPKNNMIVYSTIEPSFLIMYL